MVQTLLFYPADYPVVCRHAKFIFKNHSSVIRQSIKVCKISYSATDFTGVIHGRMLLNAVILSGRAGFWPLFFSSSSSGSAGLRYAFSWFQRPCV
jgi:hypothetical protein